MRVTTNMAASLVTGNLERNYRRILDLQNTVSTGKKVNAPSDDPLGAGQVLRLREKISAIDQYGENILWGSTWLRTTDQALGAMDTLLIRAKELAVYQASETADGQTRRIAAQEVGGIFDSLIGLANTCLNGRYVFSGQITDNAPYSSDADLNTVYTGNTGEIRVMIGEDMDMAVNLDGPSVLNGTVNVFDVLKALKQGLETHDTDVIAGQIEHLDEALKQVLNGRATVGSRLNRLETTENHWQDFKLNTQTLLSEIEDADLVKALTDLKSMESAYEAALMASASVIQPTLMDFLR